MNDFLSFAFAVAGLAWAASKFFEQYPREPKDIEISAAELARLTPAELDMRETELILMRDAVRRALLQVAGRRASESAEDK